MNWSHKYSVNEHKKLDAKRASCDLHRVHKQANIIYIGKH